MFEKFVNFILENGEAYSVTLAEILQVMTIEECEELAQQGEECMRSFFAEGFDSLYDKRFV